MSGLGNSTRGPSGNSTGGPSGNSTGGAPSGGGGGGTSTPLSLINQTQLYLNNSQAALVSAGTQRVVVVWIGESACSEGQRAVGVSRDW